MLEDYLRQTCPCAMKVDLLVALQELWGQSILQARAPVYRMVSGTCSDSAFQGLLCSHYKRFAAFANFVDERYLFGDSSIPLASRIITPAREAIRAYSEKVCRISAPWRGTRMGEHQDYLYIAFSSLDNIPDLRGGSPLC